MFRLDNMGLKILPPKSGKILLEIIHAPLRSRSTMMTATHLAPLLVS